MSEFRDEAAHLNRPRQPREIWPYGVIGAVVLALGGAFAYTAGWLSPERLTPVKMVNAIEANTGPQPAYRRAHPKGMCVRGYFESNGAGARLSRTAVFAEGRTPFIGRMSIGGGSPQAPDGLARVRSLALQLQLADGQEWRMAMNSSPVLAVATPQAFYEQVLSMRPDPATGKPVPENMAAFRAAHPETAPFQAWVGSAPYPDSFANTAYYSINAFIFVDGQGQKRPVRWVMQPVAKVVELDPATRGQLPVNYLQDELQQRLKQGSVLWQMEVVLAEAGDPVNDPTLAWPAERERVLVGQVVVEAAVAQAEGPCREVNFDPLVLPDGVKPSDDPMLHARSAVYSVSFNRRLREAVDQSSKQGLAP